jgi:hypothetical protein
MKVKDDSVNIWGLQPEMRPAMKAVGWIWEDYGQEAVITCARDGMHSAGSLHYYGLAIDVRNRYFTADQKKAVMGELKSELHPKGFDVIQHKSHIHIEYDPK